MSMVFVFVVIRDVYVLYTGKDPIKNRWEERTEQDETNSF